MIIMKFGGTSVGDGNRFIQVADIVQDNLARRPVVVLSAMSGVTDALLSMAERAQRGQMAVIDKPLKELLTRHLSALTEAARSPEQQRLGRQEIESYGKDLASILRGVSLVREATPRSTDAIAAFGEKMAVAILSRALCDRGLPARPMSAEELIVTDGNFGQAAPIMAATARLINRRIPPVLARDEIPIITGFIGRTRSGATTTLGRGGSDYSASLIGAALAAEEIWIWTDVDGVMTADPRLVPEARPLASLSYAEAAELSYFGAKVLHPRTVAPAIAKGIPVYIKNTFNPAFPGTVITGGNNAGARRDPPTDRTVVKAITSMAGMSLVTVQGAGMIGVPGIAARVFATVARRSTNVFMISQSSSEYNICFVVQSGDSSLVVTGLRQELANELRQGGVSGIWAQDEVAVLAVVGEGMRGTPGVAGRLFSALGRCGVNVIAIAQGASELNISFVVEGGQRIPALRCIHREFIA